MVKRLIFGGTAEGRAACERLLKEGGDVVVCVTSDYAARLLPKGAEVRVGAMDEGQMRAFILACKPDEVIDATHPYAVGVSKNIRACQKTLGFALARVERPGSGDLKDVSWARDAHEAAGMLLKTKGNILLTTGSHTAHVYLAALGAERVYLRVLPSSGVLAEMEKLGVLPGHLIAMQGPFSEALNLALYDQFCIRHVVSKDSGRAGGVDEKIRAARARAMGVVMIMRPDEG